MFYSSSCEHQQRSIMLPPEQSVNGRRRQTCLAEVRCCSVGQQWEGRKQRGTRWQGQLWKMAAEVAIEPSTACHSRDGAGVLSCTPAAGCGMWARWRVPGAKWSYHSLVLFNEQSLVKARVSLLDRGLSCLLNLFSHGLFFFFFLAFDCASRVTWKAEKQDHVYLLIFA